MSGLSVADLFIGGGGGTIVQRGTLTLNSTNTVSIPLVTPIPEKYCEMWCNNAAIVGAVVNGLGNVTHFNFTWINTNTNVKVAYSIKDLRMS